MKRITLAMLFACMTSVHSFVYGQSDYTTQESFVVDDIYYTLTYLHHYTTGGGVRPITDPDPGYWITILRTVSVAKDPEGVLANVGIIPETIEHNGTTFTVNSIDRKAYMNASVFEVSIPKSVCFIGKDSTFMNCFALQKVSFRQSENNLLMHKKIPRKGINLPLFLTDHSHEVGVRCFSGCRSLTSVDLVPFLVCGDDGTCGGNHHIMEYAFENCYNLKQISIPQSNSSSYVIGIDEYAFKGCSSLEDIYVEASEYQKPTCDQNAFDQETYENAVLHVPANLMNYFTTAEGWKNFQHIMPLSEASGDANGDGQINGLDVVQTVDYIVNQTYKLEVDLYPVGNPDGVINGMDLVELVELVMSQDGSQNAPAHQKTNK